MIPQMFYSTVASGTIPVYFGVGVVGARFFVCLHVFRNIMSALIGAAFVFKAPKTSLKEVSFDSFADRKVLLVVETRLFECSVALGWCRARCAVSTVVRRAVPFCFSFLFRFKVLSERFCLIPFLYDVCCGLLRY